MLTQYPVGRDSNSEGGSSPPRPGSIAHIVPLFPTPKSLERDLRGRSAGRFRRSSPICLSSCLGERADGYVAAVKGRNEAREVSRSQKSVTKVTAADAMMRNAGAISSPVRSTSQVATRGDKPPNRP